LSTIHGCYFAVNCTFQLGNLVQKLKTNLGRRRWKWKCCQNFEKLWWSSKNFLRMCSVLSYYKRPYQILQSIPHAVCLSNMEGWI